MLLSEIRAKIEGSEYDFLRNHPFLRDKIVMLAIGGSHAYGTAVEDSDLDVRGVAINTDSYILTGRDFEQHVDTATDTTVYSFEKTVRLLCECNPNVIELLGLKSEHYLMLSGYGKLLLDNRQLFLSKRAVHTFGGYATAQLRRLDNKAARQSDQSTMEQHILNSINNAAYVFKGRHAPMDTDGLKLYIDKSNQPGYDTEIFMDVNLRHYPLRDYTGMIAEMNAIIRQYGKFGRRNERAATHNKLGKHMMHLIRLYLMCFDILERGEIITCRENEHDFLMEVRNGKYLDENGQPVNEFYDILRGYEEKLKYLKDHNDLPDHPDMDKVRKLVMDVNREIVLNPERSC